MVEPRSWRQVDYPLLLTTLLLVVYGVLLIHSATCHPLCGSWSPPTSWLLSSLALRQAAFALVGVGLMALVALVDYRTYRVLAYTLWVLMLVMLVAVLVVGRGAEEVGSRRWIPLGPIDFQPSELAKLLATFAVARCIADGKGEQPTLARLIGSLFFVLVPMALVYLQPDLGSAMAFGAIWLAVVVVAGARPRHLGILGLVGLASTPLVWLLLRDYMRRRIITFVQHFVNPGADPLGDAYNILQAQISIGSGGLFGRGLTQGTQTQLDYLRVKHSDFIFSVLAEELGFVGALLLFALFIFLLFRILRAGERAPDRFGALTAAGIAGMLSFQVIVNLGANLTLLPVTGIPLPFISSGGSALVTDLMALGVVQSVLVHRLRYRF